MIEHKIISTGSKGNAVVINKTILIDCGVPFKALKDVYKDLQLVLLTHIHGDHFNRATIKRLARERPTLRFGCGEWMAGDVYILDITPSNIDVYEMDESYPYSRAELIVKPFSLVHNVLNCGYKLRIGLENMLYATDTNTLDHIKATDYSLYLVEANYSEAEITERIRRKQESEEYCHEWDVLNNHLSKEKADNWLYSNMGPNSQYVYLHEHEERGETIERETDII